MRKKLIALLESLPHVRKLAAYRRLQMTPPGHYYSPIVSPAEIEQHKESIFNSTVTQFAGLDLHQEQQFSLLEEFTAYYSAFVSTWQSGERRFKIKNSFYGSSDAIMLYSMIMKFRPKRIIEIGSGFSSALMLDVNELFLNNKTHLTFIEPYPDRLKSLTKPTDHVMLIDKPLQEVDLTIFEQLQENDILFIDSTHVSKTGSDVNKIFFDILPRLNPGVLIHFHDIFHPFEYPESWVLRDKRNWNEIYLLRSFLSFNNSFEIILFNHYLERFHETWFAANMPLCLEGHGGSIWIRRK